MPDIAEQYISKRIESNPIIYAYSDVRWPGYLKVGYTTRPVEERMKEHYPTLTPTKSYKIELIESALYPDGSNFMDHDVHKVLSQKGISPVHMEENNKQTEWYQCTIDDVKAAIIAVRTHTANIENRTQTFKMRPEQVRAVTLTREYFDKQRSSDITHSPKYLWNCKMRFGKTFASYELAKSMGMRRILILTFKPAVEDSWETDLFTHVDFEGWQFYSKKTEKENGISPDKLDLTRPIVCFGSFQDFLGTNESGGIKAKNEWVHETPWDMVIFDEYHFGAWRENAKKLFDTDEDDFDSLDVEKYVEEEMNDAINESFLPITSDYYLYLSGTPFRAINTGEFLEDQIFSWTYSDEQREKSKWKPEEHNGQDNPYAELPRMIMMTYKMPIEIERVAMTTDTNEFDLNEFFKAKTDTKDIEEAKFIHKDEVQKWLDLIRGNYLPTSTDELRLNKGDRPVLPYSDTRMKAVLNHTLWFLPNVASCFAMRNLLAEDQNRWYRAYKVNVCAGTKAGIGLAAVEPVRRSMEPALDTQTITLSCGKLTTGVTIKPWTGIFMLRKLSTPETYFQAAFRVQSPWTIKHEDGTKEIIKENCYLFDFAVNRALKQISDYSTKLSVGSKSPEEKVADFVNFLPVLAYDGSTMKPINASEILDFVTAGTSASLLARRWQSALLVNVDNDTLSKILSSEKAMEALEKIEAFRNLNKDIETIIAKSEHVKDVKKSGKQLTDTEKKLISEEEKEYKSKRKQIQEKLIKFAARVPVFMYLTEYREQSLKDVITRLEPGLFRKVTGLTLDDFELLVSLGVFNESLMNDAIWQFRRYEESSLEYTGLTKHAPNENIGMFNSVISREDFEALAIEQGLSMDVRSDFQRVQTDSGMPDIDNKPTPSHIITPQRDIVPVKPVQTYKVESKPTIGVQTVHKSKTRYKKIVKVGMRVHHTKFGDGTVARVDKEHVFIEFALSGNKMFTFSAFDEGFLQLI